MRSNMTVSVGLLCTLLLSGCAATEKKIENKAADSQKKPNFVWLVSEDNSRDYLQLYNKNGAKMPNIEALAKQGLVFNNALSNSPVCSTARTTLALGAYPARLAMEYHRPYQRINLPEGLTTVSEYLRLAGYYTTNNYKEDYNFVEPKEHWASSKKGANWRKRAEGQPFFHMQSWKTTHEHKLHFPETDVNQVKTDHDPSAMVVPKVHPDTELFRYTQARYLDLHQKLDSEIGDVIKQLKVDGLLEDTFIFYFGDHGGVLPGSKGYAFERGLNVPLVVRVPKNFRHLLHKDLQAKIETRVDGFVSFIDFLPTLLTLAGVEVPEDHDGQTFLSATLSLDDLNKRDSHFAFADRFDEKYDMVRTYRKGNFKYIRNYLPFNPNGLYAKYRYKSAAFRQWRNMFYEGQLTPEQSQFFEPKKVEALYDLDQDPDELNNLVEDKKYTSLLKSMREKLERKLVSLPDLGFYPEYYLIKEAKSNPVVFAEEKKSEIAKLQEIANLSLQPYDLVRSKIKFYLMADNQWYRYWAMNVALSFSDEAIELTSIIKKLENDANHLVAARAIQFSALNNSVSAKQPLEALIANTNDDALILAILNIAAQLHDTKGETFNIPFRASWEKPGPEVTDLMENWRQRTINTWFTARIEYLKKPL